MSRSAKSTPSPSLEEARAAKPEALGVFKRLGKLTGIGITRIGDGYGLKVNLEAHPGGDLPSAIQGVPVQIEVVGPIRKRAAA